MSVRWECRFKCGAHGVAENYRAARLAEQLHVDVAKLADPKRHGKAPKK